MKKTLLPVQVLLLFLTFLTIWSTSVWNGTDASLWFISFKNFLFLWLAGFGIRFCIRFFIDESYKARLEHRLITTFILFLLFDALVPWWIFLILGAVTEILQYLIRSPLGPLFNPAAAGALAISILGYFPSWWGVNPAPRFGVWGIDISLMAWIMAFGAAYVVYKYRKLAIAGSALLAFIISFLLLFQESPGYFVLEGTLLFFIFVMVCEPKTSPIPKKEQIIYGALIGALVPVGLYFHFLEASLIALLIGNLYGGRRFIGKIFSSAPKPQMPAPGQ